MAKRNGTTRYAGNSQTSSANTIQSSTIGAPSNAGNISNIKKLPAMPGKYKKVTFEVNGQTYSVNNTPTGYGIQQKRNGRFTLVKPDGSYVDFRYGDSYGGYTSQSEAYKELKSWVKDYIK